MCAHVEGPHHDCQYVEERNRLIPAAEALAVEECKRRSMNGTLKNYEDEFAVQFLLAMDRLWRAPRAVS